MSNILKLQDHHWPIIKMYCEGHRLYDIVDKFKCSDKYPSDLLRAAEITPRPIGFANYLIAHKWVTKVKVEYEEAYKKYEQQRAIEIAEKPVSVSKRQGFDFRNACSPK